MFRAFCTCPLSGNQVDGLPLALTVGELTCLNLAGATFSTSSATGLKQLLGAPAAKPHFQNALVRFCGGQAGPQHRKTDLGAGVEEGRGCGGRAGAMDQVKKKHVNVNKF